MKKLDIQISKAQIESFTVEFHPEKEGVGKVEMTATLALLTEQGKTITTFSCGTGYWATHKFEIPLAAIPAIKEITREIERVAVKACRDEQKQLPAKREEIQEGVIDIPF